MTLARVGDGEEFESLLGGRSLSDFSLVKEMRFSFAANSGCYNLYLQLEADGPLKGFLELSFEKVVGLQIKAFGGDLTQIRGLELVDISNSMWEDQCWEVRDFENSAISFRCAKVVVLSLHTVASS